MEKAKRVFTTEFKREAVNLVETSGKPLAQVARELGISDNTLHGWKQQMKDHGQDAFPGSGHQTPQEEEMRRLRRENEILRQERDILKKPWPSSRNPNDDIPIHCSVTTRLSHQSALPNPWCLKQWLLRVEKAAREPASSRRCQLKHVILQAYKDSQESYGSPRLVVEVQRRGYHCSRKRVARLMRECGLCARKKRCKARTTRQDSTHGKAENVLNRDFEASAPNQKWVTDVTAIWTQEGWLYVAEVLDLFSRAATAICPSFMLRKRRVPIR